MSAAFPNIVYVGDSEAGHALAATAAARNWTVYVPTELFEALGMTVSYCPDLVMIDMLARPTMAVEVYYHLRTLTGDPVRMLLIDRDDRHSRADQTVTVVPHGVSRRVLMAAVEAALRQAQTTI